LLSRNDASIHKIKKPGGKSCCYELGGFPHFNMNTMPFVFLRDDKGLYLVCVASNQRKVLQIAQARFEGKLSYKTMEVIRDPENDDEFNIAILTHTNESTSRILLLHFDTNFLDAVV
jgi:hypothetical protein